jgi:DNA-binding response OmpR family regulator
MSTNRMNILYIDDDPKMIDLVTHILQRGGYQVIGADRGKDGIAAAIKHKPDLILLDLVMPDLDGWEVYRQLKGAPQTQSIPIVIITARTHPIDRVLGLDVACADAYINKPFYPQELLDCVSSLLKPDSTSET